MSKKFILLFFILVSSRVIMAQDDKVKFGAYGRALQQNTQLGKADTLNADNVSKGHVLVDLGIHITPDKRTEVQAILRMRSDIGGFYTGGSALQLRQLYIKGLVGKYVSYQVGDLYMQMSPYTFYNNNAEGTINEASIFSNFRRDYTNYENLSNRGNSWWQQGATTNFALAFKESLVDTLRVDGFFLRNRQEGYFANAPARFHAGGRVTLTSTDKLKLIGNYVNLFEIGKTARVDSAISNPVMSLQADYTILNTDGAALSFIGEGGQSQMIFKNYTDVPAKSGNFYEASTKLHIKPANLLFTASYSYVDPNFFSSAAQSKRVNFASTPSTFPIYGNDPFNPVHRTPTIFDLVKDTAVYNARISNQLMSYNPTLNNSTPYGKATPNRQGVTLDLQYKDSAQKIMANVNGAFLSEVAGEGSISEKRKFMVLKAGIDFNIHKFIGWKKRAIITTGVRYENTKRGGSSLVAVNLTSTLIDLGLELEVLNKLDVLVGTKLLTASGNELIAVRDKFNNIINFSNAYANVSMNQSLIAYGLKYRFSANTYLTVQDHIFTYTDANNGLNNFSMNQFLIMFNMNF